MNKVGGKHLKELFILFAYFTVLYILFLLYNITTTTHSSARHSNFSYIYSQFTIFVFCPPKITL